MKGNEGGARDDGGAGDNVGGSSGGDDGSGGGDGVKASNDTESSFINSIISIIKSAKCDKPAYMLHRT